MNIPAGALSGPRGLKQHGSPEWCWQTVDMLRNYLFNIEQTWRQADEVVADLKDVQAWKVLPSPEQPYGSFNRMCRELLGMPARDVAQRIDREKIKALGPHGGNRQKQDAKANLVNNISEVKQERDTLLHQPGPRTDTCERVVARLKRDDPALADRVVRGDITPNAAARAKGWRKPRIVVSTPESVARALLTHMPPGDIAVLITLLSEPRITAEGVPRD